MNSGNPVIFPSASQGFLPQIFLRLSVGLWHAGPLPMFYESSSMSSQGHGERALRAALDTPPC